MPGLPNRPYIAELGPRLRNERPVRNPATELDAEVFELMKHLLIGSVLLSDLVEIEGNLTAGGFDIIRRREAWNVDGNVDGLFADPTIDRTSAGIITIAYPANVPNEIEGQTASLVIRGGWAAKLTDDGAFVHGYVFPTNPRSSTCTVKFRTAAGNAAVDPGRVLIRLC